VIGRENLLEQDKRQDALRSILVDVKVRIFEILEEYRESGLNPALPGAETGEHAGELSEYSAYPYLFSS
jgi:hypothetical protein